MAEFRERALVVTARPVSRMAAMVIVVIWIVSTLTLAVWLLRLMPGERPAQS